VSVTEFARNVGTVSEGRTDTNIVLTARRAKTKTLAAVAVASSFKQRQQNIMGILQGKRLLITGVLTDASLAFGVAQKALDEGAQIVLTGAGRGLSLTTRIARKLNLPDGMEPIEVLELDITDPSHMPLVVAALEAKWGGPQHRALATIFGRLPGKTFLPPFISRPIRSKFWPKVCVR
jgi:hypothetical protein